METPLLHDITGSGEPVLMVHGLFTHPRVWAPVVERLAPRFRVIRCNLPDRRGIPRRAIWPEPDAVQEVLGLLDDLEVSEAHLLGHGAACATVLGLAGRQPCRARSIALVDPRVRRAEAEQESHLLNLLQWLEVGHRNLVRLPANVEILRKVIAEQTICRWGEPHADLHLTPTMIDNQDPASLAVIPCPVLTLLGERGNRETRAVVAEITGHLRHGRLMAVPHAEHNCLLQAPGAVAGILEQYLVG